MNHLIFAQKNFQFCVWFSRKLLQVIFEYFQLSCLNVISTCISKLIMYISDKPDYNSAIRVSDELGLLL